MPPCSTLAALCLAILAVPALSEPLPAQTTIHEWIGPGPGSFAGWSVAFLGDVDGDRVNDVGVGAPFRGNGGVVYVYSGRSGAQLFELVGPSSGGLMGNSVCAAGDANGDGVPDLAAGAPSADVPGIGQAGEVVVWSGADGSVLRTIPGQALQERFGYALDGGFDADRDGLPDLLVGAPEASASASLAGAARVHSAVTGAMLREIGGTLTDDRFAFAVAIAGDTNADGWLDYVVGVPEDDTVNGNAGSVHVYSGRDGGLLHQYFGTGAMHRFGSSVDGAGDVDGDGFADIVVGAPYEGPFESGAAYVYSSLGATLLHRLPGAANGNQHGFRVAGAGDLDGDGRADLAVSAWMADVPGKTDVGSVTLYAGASGQELRTLRGAKAGDVLGFDLAGAGWRGTEALPDLLVGATGVDGRGFDSGAVYGFLFFSAPIITSTPLVAGSSATLSGTWFTPNGLATFGFSLTGGGPTSTLHGEVLLSRPIHLLPPVAVDPQGAASIPVLVPATWSGRTVWAQAMDGTERGTSNGLVLVVQ